MSTTLGHSSRLGARSQVEQERLLPPDSIPDSDYCDDDSGPAQPSVTLYSTSAGDVSADEESGIKLEGRQGDGWARNLVITGMVVLVITTWTAILANNPAKYSWFAFHPPLQTLALCFFTYGIMTLQPTYQPKTKAAGFVRHQRAIFFLGTPILFLGTLASALYKIEKGYPQFLTWHARFGLICWIWMIVQIFLGAGSIWNGGSLFGGGTKAKAIWKYHRLSGYLLFVLWMFTVHLGGGQSTWGETYTSEPIRLLAYTVAPTALVIGVWSRARTSKMQFF